MFDIARKTRLGHSFRRPAKRILVAAAAFTLLAGGSALAAESTSSQSPTNQTPSAQSLLPADQPGVTVAETEIETPGSVKVEDSDPAGDAAEVAAVTDAADVPAPADAVEPDKDARGVHGACVSAVAKDRSTVGREHGAAVSAAAHSCANGSDAVTDVETPDAAEAQDVEKPEAAEAQDVEKADATETHRAQKSAAGKSHSHHRG